MYSRLSKTTAESVLRTLRSLNWTAEAPEFLLRIFTKPWKIKFSNLYLLAFLTSELARWHYAFVIDVVDSVLDDIFCAM